MIDIETAQGTGQAYVAVPASGRGPGVLVLHAWWGLNDFFKELCDRLAGEGFVALAPDLNNGQIATTIDEAEALMKTRNRPLMQAMAEGGLARLQAHPAVDGTQVGVIGFSLGASWAIALSGEFPEAFAAVVDFYGTGETDFARARAAYLCHFADPDEWEPLEDVRAMEAAMQAAGREVTLHLYPGAGHWFFEGDRPDAYRPAEAEQAWTRTVEFLRRYL